MKNVLDEAQKVVNKADTGYHIRDFPADARRLAKAGSFLSGKKLGSWIAEAVREKWQKERNEH